MKATNYCACNMRRISK